MVRAHGDSMEPRILDGDLVLFEARSEAPDGSVIACSDNGRAYIKRMVRAGKKIMLYSLNTKYEPFPADPETFRIEGIAQAVLGRI
jgi:repressor LexA